MKNNIGEKSLTTVESNNLIDKIKSFFKGIFGKKQETYSPEESSKKEENINLNNVPKEDNFLENIKYEPNNEAKLLKFQKKIDEGNIKTNELSEEQVSTLIELYKKQIKELEKSNEKRERKLLQYKKAND